MSDNSTNFLNGIGQLYVLIGENNITSFKDLQKGHYIQGIFPASDLELDDSIPELEKEVQNLNVLDFMRLEDTEYNKVDSSIIYITDTGSCLETIN